MFVFVLVFLLVFVFVFVLVFVVVVVFTVVVVLLPFVMFVVLFTIGNALSFTDITTAELLFEGALITYTPYPVPTKNATTKNINRDIFPLDIPLFVGTGAGLGVVTYFSMRASFSSLSSSSFCFSE